MVTLLFMLSFASAAALADVSEALTEPMNTCPQTVPAAPFTSPAPDYQRHYHTIAHQFLDDEKAVSQVTVEMVAILDALIAEAVAILPPYPRNLQAEQARPFAVQALNQIDCILLRHGFVYPGRGTVQLLSDGLVPTRFPKFRYLNDVYRHPHNIRRRTFVKARGFGPFYVVDCDIAAYLYIAIGQVLGYPLHLIDIPNHIFVRWELGEGRFINYETMDGLVTDDHYYRRKWQIPDALIQKGGILRSMSIVEAKAYHDASIAEAWSWQQAHQATRDGYLRAIQHDATRPFALNNLAWFYIAAPLPKADNAAMAIKYAQLAAKVFPTGDNFDTLACAYAQAHDFTRALNTAKQAMRINYAPFESDIAGHIKRFEQKRGCDTSDFGRELKPFRPPQEEDIL